MILIIMAVATVLIIMFLFLYLGADENITGILLGSRREMLMEAVDTNNIRIDLLTEEINAHPEIECTQRKKQIRKLDKQNQDAQKQLDSVEQDKIGIFDSIPVAGYRLIQLLGWDGTNPFMARTIRLSSHYLERQEAINNAYYCVANLMGYTCFGIAAAILLLVLTISMGLGFSRIMIVTVIVFAIFFIVGYIPYNNMQTTVKTRKEAINNAFPQVISKLTLLTEAGMEVNTAWKLTSEGRGVLYEEMGRVNIALANNVPPADAYTQFIQRCGTTYTSKLATLIIQNMFKGNSEIIRQFEGLNKECWDNFRNDTTRLAEKVQTKLFVPTMLMFVGILIMIIIPVMSSIGSF